MTARACRSVDCRPAVLLGGWIVLLTAGAVTGLAGQDPSARRPPLAEWRMFRGAPDHPGSVNTRGVERPGRFRWTLRTEGPVRSSAAVVDEVLYVGSDDGGLYAVDAVSGRVMWRYDAGAPVNGSPAVSDELVFVTDGESTLHAVGLADGVARWRVQTGPSVPFPWGREGWDYYASSPVPVGDVVLFGAGDGRLRAVDRETGERRWRFATGGRIRSTPAVREGRVFVGSADGVVYSVDLESGRERWRFETEGASLDAADFGFDRRTVQASPTVVDGVVYVGGRDANLYALDAGSGELRWVSNDSTSAWVVGTPAVADGVVYETRSSSGLARALDASTGEELWRADLGGYSFVSPVVVSDLLYVASETGRVVALDRTTGTVRWSRMLDGPVYASPVVLDGTLYAGADDGVVRALAAADGPAPRRAVYWDTAFAGRSVVGRAPAHRRLVDHLVAKGWEAVDADGLRTLLEDGTTGEDRSVVVFAMDGLPEDVATPKDVAAEGDATLLERYLRAGGKAVWVGFPPFFLRVSAETGERSVDLTGAEPLSGVDESLFRGDSGGQWPTAAGRRWGLGGWWTGFTGLVAPSHVEVLAVDALGRATAWAHHFGGPPGTGFVRFLDVEMSEVERERFRRMAEYGVFRSAH